MTGWANETPSRHPHLPHRLSIDRPHHRTASGYSGILALGRSSSVMGGTVNDVEREALERRETGLLFKGFVAGLIVGVLLVPIAVVGLSAFR